MEEEFPVKCFKKYFEIGHFLKYHPGGVNYVKNFRNKDVQKRMNETKHAKTAFYLLREYEKKNGRDTSTHDEDEDLENLVDWNKPMLSQVGNLGPKYSTRVMMPVHRDLRLFGNPILESLTKTPWYLVPVIWLPVITFFLYIGFNKFSNSTSFEYGHDINTWPSFFGQIEKFIHLKITDNSVFALVTSSMALTGFGGMMWTLLEYMIHRWVFHKMPTGNNKLLIVFHFLVHGLHHKVPFDHMRLVFPPFPAAIIICVLYFVYSTLCPDSTKFLIAGGTFLGELFNTNKKCVRNMSSVSNFNQMATLGYVIYDMIHFYLHYGAPKENTFLYNMKRYHNQHHFVHQDAAFGVSNKTWDFFFGTIISLKKLVMPIKWSS